MKKEYLHIPARSDYDAGVISVPAAAPATVACIGEYRPNHHISSKIAIAAQAMTTIVEENTAAT